MKAKTVQIYWHDKQPIYSVDFEPCKPGRLATCGADSNVRLWKMVSDANGNPHMDFVSNLSRHSASVNAVRWSPLGGILASAGDDGTIILWKQTEHEATAASTEEFEEFNKETWKIQLLLRGSGSDIYDIAWSPDASMIASGSIDNAVRIHCSKTGKCLQVLAEHSHFVQGVAWDPLGKYIATQSSDRSVLIYSSDNPKKTFKLESKFTRINSKTMPPPETPLKSSSTPASPSRSSSVTSGKSFRMYHDETLTSFFRRLTFLPDGSMLLTPASQVKQDDEATEFQNTVYIYARGHFDSEPTAFLPGLKRPSIAIRACPKKYKLRELDSAFKLPYRLVYAVATQDSVLIYDTQDPKPLCVFSNLHYATFTDITWSMDGSTLVMSSTDGFCSMVSFDENELGEPLDSVKVAEPLQAEQAATLEKRPVNDISNLVRKKIKS